MDIYTDSGCHNNDQCADFALMYVDNGKCFDIITAFRK